MIGMNAVVLDDAVVNDNTIIAAGSVVTKGTFVEANSVYAGIPAKKIKSLSPELAENELHRIANAYSTYASVITSYSIHYTKLYDIANAYSTYASWYTEGQKAEEVK